MRFARSADIFTAISRKTVVFARKRGRRRKKQTRQVRTYLVAMGALRPSWRRHPDLNRGIRALQAHALPLGYSADNFTICRGEALSLKPSGYFWGDNKKIVRLNWWSGKRDSNPRHSPWQGDALPLSHSRISIHPHYFVVGATGLEPVTHCL